MSFDLSRLAAKQKRLKDWSRFTKQEVVDAGLRSTIDASLKQFRDALATCWDAGSVSEEMAKHIENLERSLEELNEAARLKVT